MLNVFVSAAHVAHMPHLVEGSEYGESLCVEVGEESLDDRLRALDTELELISQGAGDVTSEQDDEGPNKKRPRLEVSILLVIFDKLSTLLKTKR